MKRYWFEFTFDQVLYVPPGLTIGCGVTAQNLEDALSILKKKVFKEAEVAPIVKCIENVDLSTLDSNHVIPNINPNSPPNIRGIWFPMGY